MVFVWVLLGILGIVAVMVGPIVIGEYLANQKIETWEDRITSYKRMIGCHQEAIQKAEAKIAELKAQQGPRISDSIPAATQQSPSSPKARS